MNHHDAIVIGGGPAGSSAAARLAAYGVRVVVLEKGRMPRQKLCGEFITPESLPSLARLGVIDRILAAGAQKITRLRLVASNGKSVETPVSEISDKSWALSLSRARFDELLLDAARRAGAMCLEGYSVKGCFYNDGVPAGVEGIWLASGRTVKFHAPLVVDASGRNSRVMVSKSERIAGRRGSRLYALKAHLKGVQGINEQVELYFFPGGYGGVSSIEDGLVNLCFITDETSLMSSGGEGLTVMRETVLRNSLARERLSGAEIVGKWVTGGPLVFGRRRLAKAGVIAIGDASGMIDPFTGTGIQIAVRTGELAAEAIIEAMGSNSSDRALYAEAHTAGADGLNVMGPRADDASYRYNLAGAVLSRYSARYEREFGRRMKIAGLLRAPAFSPRMANLFERVLSASPRLARAVLRASRSGERAPSQEQRP